MRIKFGSQLLKDIDDGHLDRFGINMERMRFGATSLIVDAEDIGEEAATQLVEIVKKSKAFGAKGIVHDLGIYLQTMKELKKGKGKGFLSVLIYKVEYFATYLRNQLKNEEVHRVYVQDVGKGVMECCYIFDIEYTPAEKRRDYHIPEHVTIRLAWEEFGEPHTRSVIFYSKDCVRLNIKEALRRQNIYFADPGQDKHYKETIERYNSIVSNVGEQYLASGVGEELSSGRSYWWKSNDVVLDKGGEPSQVVIDVFNEGDEEKSNSKNSMPDLSWWVTDVLQEEFDEKRVYEELPIHPTLVIFALKKQMRLQVHVDQLVKYEYDHSLGKKLILPTESTNLVHTLVNFKGEFQDIVKNKGGGAIVLCEGIPGTGKTLTAEVYSETMDKPLYSVQCSQLGTDPEELEKELLTIFSRSERWSAILLLDEADVYIRHRGDDLKQNAIVGVFLRVLEYYHGVLFMTTNRSDLVDDAIASRCVARIHYDAPGVEDAEKIWNVLAPVFGVKVTPTVVKQLVRKYNGGLPETRMTGRDIKNILKLVRMTQNGSTKPVTLAQVEFALKFKPTR